MIFPQINPQRVHHLNRQEVAPEFPLNEMIKKIAMQSLAELVVSLTIACAVTFIATTTFGAGFFIIAALVQCAVNTSFRSLGLFCLYQASRDPDPESPYKHFANIFSWCSPFVFSNLSAINGQTLIHESGHAIAANLFFKNADPKIVMNAFGSAYTEYTISELTLLGSKLGKQYSNGMVALAGPVLTLSVSAALLGAGIAIKDKHPETSRYLIAASICDFLFHALYALSALITSSKNHAHDFVRLASIGVHPILATIVIIAIPILTAYGVGAIQNRLAPPEIGVREMELGIA